MVVEKKVIYYCGHCEPRPEEREGVEIIKRNHDACVIKVALPVLRDVSERIVAMGVKKP